MKKDIGLYILVHGIKDIEDHTYSIVNAGHTPQLTAKPYSTKGNAKRAALKMSERLDIPMLVV